MMPSDITAFRDRWGFTRVELAEAIGTSRGAIGLIEEGRRPVTPKMAERFKTFFSFVTGCAEGGRL